MSRVDLTEAQRMRSEGQTLEEIGQRFGVTRERVRQLLGPAPAAATNCKTCGIELPEGRDRRTLYCSKRCRNRSHNLRTAVSCPSCGKLCRGKSCKDCKRAEWGRERKARWDKLEALWSEGLSMKQIAAELGTTTNALGGELVRARNAGRDLPRRRAKSPKSKELTKSEARFQLTAALRNGQIRRPNRCEECGERRLVDAHHTDYQRPLYVEWLCGDCHIERHGGMPATAVLERQAA